MDSHFLTRIKDQVPEIAQAIATGNPRTVAEKLYEMALKRKENESRKQVSKYPLVACCVRWMSWVLWAHNLS